MKGRVFYSIMEDDWNVNNWWISTEVEEVDIIGEETAGAKP